MNNKKHSSSNQDQIEPKDEGTRVIKLTPDMLQSNNDEQVPTTHACLVAIYYADANQGSREQIGKKYELTGQQMIIGRAKDCNIIIKDSSVSRNHCKLNITKNPNTQKEAIYVTDLNSTNGTRINDVIISPYQHIQDGDTLQCGGVIFKFLAGDNIENNYYDEIYKLTTVDGLTQAFNRRYFSEVLDREIGRANRYGRPLSMIMFDIDHFKHINDKYGHLAGDHVLRKLSSTVKRAIRQEDIFSRYGGEEFTIILPEIPIQNAWTVAEKIRITIENLNIHYEDKYIPVTISLGVVQYNRNMKTGFEFIKAADDLLYHAKETGRNKTCG